MKEEQIRYYSERAREYEQIYEKPERQEDLTKLKSFLKKTFRDRSVYEIACGTGYWTQVISETASSVFASDINETVLEIARLKQYVSSVKFGIADIYNLPQVQKKHDVGFAGFLWSHIPRQDVFRFLSGFTALIPKGGWIVFIDNQFVKGSSTPLKSTDEHGNTYQKRKLASGKHYLIIKNFPTDQEIIDNVEPFGANISIKRLEYFWILKFQVR